MADYPPSELPRDEKLEPITERNLLEASDKHHNKGTKAENLEEDVQIKFMSLGDILTFRKWLDDDEIVKLAFGVEEVSDTVRSIANRFKINFFRSYLRFRSIKYKGKTIGFINYMIIPSPERKIAKIGIVIGDRNYWGKGIGPVALRKFLSYLFTHEGVEVVQLDTAEFNTRAQKAFKKVGFKVYGYDDNRKKIFMEIDRESFLAMRGK